MADIEKDVLVKIDTKIGSGDGLGRTTKDAREAGKSVGELRKEAITASSSFSQLSRSFAEIDKKRAFQTQVADLRKCVTTVEEFKRKVNELAAAEENAARRAKELSEMTAKGASGAGGEGGGKGGLGGFRSTMRGVGMVARVAELGSSEAAIVAGNLSGARAQGGPLQKGERGLLLNQWDKVRDEWSGRTFRERGEDQAIEKNSLAIQYRGALEQNANKASDAGLLMRQQSVASLAYNPYGKTSEVARLKWQMSNLGEESGAVNARMGFRQPGMQRDYARYDEATDRLNATGGKQGMVQRMTALDSAKQAMEAQRADAEKLVQLETQRVQLAKQIADTARDEVKAKRESFAQMDEFQQRDAVDLGARLKKGERLQGADLESAQSMPVLRDLLMQQKTEDVDKSGAFAKFLAATGNESEQKAANKALAVGGGAKVEMYLDEAKLADEIAKRGFDFIKKLKQIEDEQARLARVTADAKIQQQQAKNAAAPPP